jgi:hypothetical protein
MTKLPVVGISVVGPSCQWLAFPWLVTQAAAGPWPWRMNGCRFVAPGQSRLLTKVQDADTWRWFHVLPFLCVGLWRRGVDMRADPDHRWRTSWRRRLLFVVGLAMVGCVSVSMCGGLVDYALGFPRAER